MISRASFIPWYRVVRSTLGSVVADLSDVDVMEYVEGSVLTIPLSQQGREARPLPIIEVELGEAFINIAIAYRDADSLKHLRNLLHPSQTGTKTTFISAMQGLPTVFETRLMKRAFKEEHFSLVRKYVGNRVDSVVLQRLIDEAEGIRIGGRQSSGGVSVYSAPATPVLRLVHAQSRLDDGEFKTLLAVFMPVVEVVSSIKTQREMIHSRISKSVEQANDYRGFVTLLNKARGLDLVSAEERRGLEKRWREVPSEREPIEEDLRRRLGGTT